MHRIDSASGTSLVNDKMTSCSPKPNKKPRIMTLKRVSSNRHYSKMTPELPTCPKKFKERACDACRSLFLSKDGDGDHEEEEEMQEDGLESARTRSVTT